jgi:O-antigen/teichoic acid export membrane protein
VLLALRRNEALLISNAAALVANIVLTLVLVPLLQARGAAIAAVVAESCLAGVQLFMVTRHVAVQISLGSIAVPLLGGVLGAALLLVPDLPSIARTAIGAIVYVGVLAAFRRIPPEIGHALDRRPAAVR